jgi:hypothetical protein
MSYWEGVAAGATNLRLFEPGSGWRCNDDEKDVRLNWLSAPR